MNIKKIWPPLLLIILIAVVAGAYYQDKHSPESKIYINGVALVGDPHTLEVGTQCSIIWDSKNVETVTVALEKDGKYVKNLIWNLGDNGGAVWTPDRSLEPGDNYQIVITAPGTRVTAKSKNFTIEP